MGHTYTSLHYHIVFSTKDRSKLIFSEIKEPLLAYVAKTINNEFGFTRKANCTEDHIHICADLKSRFALSDIMRKLKANSSHWVNSNFQLQCKFAWQEGYGAFSVSKSSIKDVLKYVVNQEEHHKTMTFKEEFIKLLEKHEVEYEKKYIWV
jgi:REP-associated tyrosine transposase